MAAAASLPLPYPEAATIAEATLAEQSLALASVLPVRPLVLGGCCCAHIGAVEGLVSRQGRLAVVWIDAHGDLNTPASSPSGNEWGMPLRMLLDGGAVEVADVVLVGARNLDPPEQSFIDRTGLARDAAGIGSALEGTDAVYVALDADALDPVEGLSCFMPEASGLTVEETEELLRRVVAARPLAGAGFTGLTASERNLAPLARFCAALGL
jgi:arginase